MYIVVEGPIGVGKTSLARLLAERLTRPQQPIHPPLAVGAATLNLAVGAATLNLEVVEENPFLAQFYEDPVRYGFNVQVFFLLSRFKQLLALSQGSLFAQSVVSDYMFDKDFIFASMNLHDAEFQLYQDLYNHLKPRLPHPDLTVYLRAEPQLLLERIAKRNRSFEHHMSSDYLLALNQHYDDYFQSYQGPLLVLEAKDFDFIENIFDRQRVFDLIDGYLLRATDGHRPQALAARI
jgi:deoxyguanosine kinase